jgi:hypothetical protein
MQRDAWVIGRITRLNKNGLCRGRRQEKHITRNEVGILDVTGVSGEGKGNEE